eukprot:299353_1
MYQPLLYNQQLPLHLPLLDQTTTDSQLTTTTPVDITNQFNYYHYWITNQFNYYHYWITNQFNYYPTTTDVPTTTIQPTITTTSTTTGSPTTTTTGLPTSSTTTTTTTINPTYSPTP